VLDGHTQPSAGQMEQLDRFARMESGWVRAAAAL
jgi:hypothetical protein